jgi:hypothetical protein
MEKTLVLNPSGVFREKNGIYVFYFDFNYIFFTGEAAKLLGQVINSGNNEKIYETLPKSFLNYLITKKIILEELP